MNIERDRLEVKLKLWETQGFSQFLQDLAFYKTDPEITRYADELKKLYQLRIKEIDDEGSKFKQTKLEL